ncbi:hypothetical protein KBC04_01065 [Candidatus Babeliales bacterium]|nr:hypothetical protein [Candidatus Babeliales bacterium]MBP9843674.1 hypothetical protein [Candidatus Babeliales bacterium]
MKKSINSKKYVWALAILVMISCYNGSVVNNSAEQAPTSDINFYGILEDHAHTCNVESILVGGKYESIPVYQQNTFVPLNHKNNPTMEQVDPKQNKILINLQDIKSISLEHPHNPTESSIQINNKIYIQIIVESLQGTKKHYLVESSRKITCKEIDKSADVQQAPTLHDRDLNFIHIKKLIIKGYKSNYPYKAPEIGPISKTPEQPMPKAPTMTESEKEKFKESTAELLNAIEENVKNMPLDNPTAFETMRSTVLTLLKSLRDQLQKFLDMIK